MKVCWPGFNVQPVLLSRVTGSVSSVNLSAFDVIGSKAREIAGDNIVTIRNEESFPWQHRILSPKLLTTALPRLTQLIIVVITVENNAIIKSERIGKMKTLLRIFPWFLSTLASGFSWIFSLLKHIFQNSKCINRWFFDTIFHIRSKQPYQWSKTTKFQCFGNKISYSCISLCRVPIGSNSNTRIHSCLKLACSRSSVVGDKQKKKRAVERKNKGHWGEEYM